MTMGGADDLPRAAVRWVPLTDARRAEVIRALRHDIADSGLNRTSGLRSLLRGAMLLLLVTPTAYLAVQAGAWWAWGLHLTAATTVLCTLPALYHEATHGNVSSNRVVNNAIGTLAAALHGTPFATWRYFHLTHHANTGTEDDSEVYGTHWSRWTLITFPVTQWAFLIVLWRWTFASMRNGGPRWIRSARQRHTIRVNTVGTYFVWIVEISACVLYPEVVMLLLVPSALSLMVASLTLVPEHFPAYRLGPGEADQLDRTGTFHSNPLLRLIMWNSNFHAAHHFAPKVPAHQLRTLDRMISEIQDPKWRWPGYFRWYRDRLAQLSWTPIDLSNGQRNVDTTEEN